MVLLYCLYETQLPGYLVKYFSLKRQGTLIVSQTWATYLKHFQVMPLRQLWLKKEEEEEEEEGNFEMVFKVIGPDFDQTFSLLELIKK